MQLEHQSLQQWVAAMRPADKSGRTRYLRHFPERAFFLLARLSSVEFVAAYRVALEYVVCDGQLPADDRRLAAVAMLSPKAWAVLRNKLLEMGVARIDQGWWVDDDQAGNLQVQRSVSERGKRGASARWAARNAA